MNTILVDTSTWINFIKGNSTKSTIFLKDNIDDVILATCPVIVQEVLQGIALDSDYKYLSEYFDGIVQLTGNPYLFAKEAAQLYRKLRKSGVTVRKPNDCLIATYALKNEIMLLEDDKDFQKIADYTLLKILDKI